MGDKHGVGFWLEERDGCYYKISVTGAMGVPAQKSEIELWERLEEVAGERDAARKDNDDLDDENNNLGELRTDDMLMIEAQKQEIAHLKDLLSPPFEPSSASDITDALDPYADYGPEEISKADELEARQEEVRRKGYFSHKHPCSWKRATDKIWERVRNIEDQLEEMK